MVRELCSRIIILIAVAALWGAPQIAGAQGLGALIIKNDIGGRVDVRMREIERLRSEGRPVELRGEGCTSSCTMFLVLENVCVDPRTTFNFHGPSFYGIPLSPESFEYWSKVLASYYKEPLREWYLEKARYRLMTYYPISGKELIRLGYRACET